ncbi:Hypothetical predicted protein [Mytilus galloprovincialis]|uniref:Uncharacterized protein n=1 Tax=Mytilus galloprovincialis TaxID=29158 RepID=A0A8B6EDV9_MYTGA|nr:Hypothetical predicted protein [Mytilus galloprovincialis]
MQRFNVLHCGDVEKLIKKRQSLTDPILYYAYAEEIYSIIMRAHLNTGHSRRDKMLKEVNKKYRGGCWSDCISCNSPMWIEGKETRITLWLLLLERKSMVINWELKMEDYLDFTPGISLNCLTVTFYSICKLWQ